MLNIMVVYLNRNIFILIKIDILLIKGIS